MPCPRCQHENEAGAKFCEECAAPLARACAECGRPLSPTAKFCPECAHPTGPSAAPAPAQRFDSPESYTPKHLAERILTSKAALEGERKQVTVLFADLKGSMELLADRDAEEARKLLDPVLERMMEAVHRYEGTVNQVMGDGIMALFGAPLAHEDHAVRACYAALRMQELVKRYAEAARRAGMRTLMEDGIAKAALGLTTLTELGRAVPPDSGRPAAAALPAAPGAAAGTQRPAPAASAAPANARVLVVEDSPTIVTVVQYYLELEGFTVTVAADGAQGLALARQERPDVVVTDLSMPGMDGIALVQALRADPRTERTAILVLTAGHQPRA